jgi:hypothetical protein
VNSQPIYTDSQRTIKKLEADTAYKRIAEVYKPNGKLVAGLYVQRAVS